MSPRLMLAQKVCRWMPPILSMRVRLLVYPQAQAFQDDFSFHVKAQTGSDFCGRTGDFHGYPFSVHGYYEWRNWAVAFALCRPGDTIIEIGANVGTETVGFRDIVGPTGKVFAFEPMPANLDALRELSKLNAWDNVDILPIALGLHDGTATFVLPPDKHASGVGHIAPPTALPSSKTIEVQCARLDSLAAWLGRAKAIFCDTEGAEPMVLRGASSFIREHKPALVLECSPKLLRRAGSSVEALRQVISELHYCPFVIGRFGVSPVSGAAERESANWLCLHESEVGLVKQCSKSILRCAVLPCIRGLNPLCRD